jgi:hypothetical protein
MAVKGLKYWIHLILILIDFTTAFDSYCVKISQSLLDLVLSAIIYYGKNSNKTGYHKDRMKYLSMSSTEYRLNKNHLLLN